MTRAMSSGRIHPGGIPPQTRRDIDARLEALLAAHAEELAKAGFWQRARLHSRLEDQAFFAVTGCQRSLWDWRCGAHVVH